MKRISLRKFVAPTPRYTLWVPVVVSGGLSCFWLLLVALINR